MSNSQIQIFASLGQGFYYLATGLWPIASRKTFERVTGPKVDFWLVKTLGALISVIGGLLLDAGLRGSVSREASLLGIGSAIALTASDVVFVAKRRISPVYLLDAVAEVLIILLWGSGRLQETSRRK